MAAARRVAMDTCGPCSRLFARPGITTPSNRHHPQAHLLAKSLIKDNETLGGCKFSSLILNNYSSFFNFQLLVYYIHLLQLHFGNNTWSSNLVQVFLST